jgi:hypothetical protein
MILMGINQRVMIMQQMRLFFIMTCSLLLIQCGGGDGGGSSTTEQGINVTFNATIQQSPAATGQIPLQPAGIKTFVNTEGVQITLTKAYLTLWSVTLEKDCHSASFTLLPPFQWNWLISSAQAHTDTTPTRLGIPNVIDLLATENSPITLGSIGPPPGDYCGLTVELLKADADAQNLPKDFNMLDRTVYLEGQYLSLGNTTAIPFVIETARTLREARLRYPSLLTLSSTQRQATTTVNIVYDRWFDGVDFSALAEPAQQDWIFNQITHSLSLR